MQGTSGAYAIGCTLWKRVLQRPWNSISEPGEQRGAPSGLAAAEEPQTPAPAALLDLCAQAGTCGLENLLLVLKLGPFPT